MYDASDRWEIRSYKSLLIEAKKMAMMLRKKKIDRVVIVAPARRYFVPAVLGALKAQCLIEFLPNLQSSYLDYLVKLSFDPSGKTRTFLLYDKLKQDEELGITSMDHAPISSILSNEAWDGEQWAPDSFQKEMSSYSFTGEEPCLRLQTSGTTQDPKSILKKTKHLLGEVQSLNLLFDSIKGLTDKKQLHIFATVPNYHLYGLLYSVFLPIKLGACSVDSPRLFGSDVARVLWETEAQVLVSTPSHLRTMYDQNMPKSLTVISSGSHLQGELHLKLCVAHRWSLIDVLGSTETGGIAIRDVPFSPWKCLPLVNLEQDKEGSMVVASPWTSQCQTQDRIALHSDGRFSYLGRQDDIVKIGGKRISLAQIEAFLLRQPGVTDAAVYAEQDLVRGTKLYFFACPESLNKKDILNAFSSEFEGIFKPKRIIFTSYLPRNAQGKVSSQLLKNLLDLPDEMTKVVSDSEKELQHTNVTSSASCIHFLSKKKDNLSQENRCWFEVNIPSNMAFFSGHFPNLRIMPGVVQIERLLLPLMIKEWPFLGLEGCLLRRLKRVRFQRPLFPGEQIEVNLSMMVTGPNENKVRAEIYCRSESAFSAFFYFNSNCGVTKM